MRGRRSARRREGEGTVRGCRACRTDRAGRHPAPTPRTPPPRPCAQTSPASAALRQPASGASASRVRGAHVSRYCLALPPSTSGALRAQTTAVAKPKFRTSCPPAATSAPLPEVRRRGQWGWGGVGWVCGWMSGSHTRSGNSGRNSGCALRVVCSPQQASFTILSPEELSSAGRDRPYRPLCTAALS